MKDYKKYFILPATPEEVYLALTNPFTIELWSGDPAIMSTEPGSEFSMFDGSIEGRNIEFEENKKIVQEWYFGEEEPSIVTIKLHEHKGEATSMEVKQTNIPDDAYEDMLEGWNDVYFEGLMAFFDIEE
jgi:activator of HSP90 ATPase